MEAGLVVDENFARSVVERWRLDAVDQVALVLVEGITIRGVRAEACEARHEQIQMSEPTILPARHGDNKALFCNDKPRSESCVTADDQEIEDQAR